MVLFPKAGFIGAEIWKIRVTECQTKARQGTLAPTCSWFWQTQGPFPSMSGDQARWITIGKTLRANPAFHVDPAVPVSQGLFSADSKLDLMGIMFLQHVIPLRPDQKPPSPLTCLLLGSSIAGSFPGVILHSACRPQDHLLCRDGLRHRHGPKGGLMSVCNGLTLCTSIVPKQENICWNWNFWHQFWTSWPSPVSNMAPPQQPRHQQRCLVHTILHRDSHG